MRHYLIMLTLAALAGCQAPSTAPKIAQGDAALPGGDSAAFLDRLSSQGTVTEADALKGVLLVMGEDKSKTFAEAVAFLRARKVVAAGWDFQASRPVTRGRVAYMIYQACPMPGGLTLTLTGPSERYCLRELQYRGFMSPGFTYNAVTGMEYVAILARADELRQTGDVSPVMVKEAAGP